MTKQITVLSLHDLQTICSAATSSSSHVDVTDHLGAVANAKSMLGLLALDRSQPVHLACDNGAVLEEICAEVAPVQMFAN